MAKVEIEDTELADLRKQAREAEKNKALYEATNAKLTEAQTVAAKVTDLEKQLGEFRTRELDSTFSGAGIVDAKVRKIFELEYADLAADATTGQKPALGEWLSSMKALAPDKQPAHLAPFLKGGAQTPGQQTPGQQTQTRGTPAPDANKGAQQVNGAPPAFTPEQIKNMSDAEFAKNLPALQSAHPELRGIPVPTQTNPQ